MIHLGKRSWRPAAAVGVALVSLAMVLASSVGAGAASRTAAAPPSATALSPSSLIAPGGELTTTSRILGTASDGRAVTGRFIPQSSRINSAGRLVLRGTLSMLVGGVTPVRTIASLPVKSMRSEAPTSGLTAAALAPGACSILNLVLGPLDLDLLGLQIHLDRVVLNIIAQSGAGNLLGNLLCAVAGLLDGLPLSALLGQISALLNSILAILNQP